MTLQSNGISYINPLSQEDKSQLRAHITVTNGQKMAVEKKSSNQQIIFMLLSLLLVGVAIYAGYSVKEHNVLFYMFEILVTAVAAVLWLIFRSDELSKRVARMQMHLDEKVQKDDENLCIKYKTQLEITEYLEELKSGKYDEISGVLTIGNYFDSDDYIPVEFTRKYAEKDSGKVMVKNYIWSLCYVGENTKVTVPTLDINTLELKLPVSKKEEKKA